MSAALTTAGVPSAPAPPAADIEKAAALARQEKAKATQRAYRKRLRDFPGNGAPLVA